MQIGVLIFSIRAWWIISGRQSYQNRKKASIERLCKPLFIHLDYEARQKREAEWQEMLKDIESQIQKVLAQKQEEYDALKSKVDSFCREHKRARRYFK
jgi:cell division septum initiation protein DivIVA